VHLGSVDAVATNGLSEGLAPLQADVDGARAFQGRLFRREGGSELFGAR